jgi:predicted Holliday junction resolvase-like endonuclease
MKRDLTAFYRVQRNIFGICPKSGEIFRLSGCKVFLKTRPKRDWRDELDDESDLLDREEQRLNEREDKWREAARRKGREQARKLVQRIDPVFTPRKLNPDDAKVLFHPVDYIVFNGMKANSLRNLLLLDRTAADRDRRKLQHSVEAAISRGHYEWTTFLVDTDGTVRENDR